MTELEQAIAKTIANGLMSAGYHDAADYVLSDWMAGAISRATGQLVPAVAWQPIETMPDCVEVLVLARGWEIPSIGFASDGVGPYDPISGGEFDPWPTYWMPLPPPPAEGV